MRNRRSSSSRPLVIWAVIIALLGGALWYLWTLGGEKDQVRVEKVISPDRFTQ